MSKKVIMIGWHPSVVDYSKFPGLTEDKLSSALIADKNKLIEQGYDASWVYLYKSDSAVEDLSKLLKENTYDVIMIGAGVRKVDEHFLLFEKLINVIHELAPKSKIAFNTGPTDSDSAIKRWA
ncbi:MAG: hypothetical protein ACK5V3_02035 [Bdellovibrionales bacterium]